VFQEHGRDWEDMEIRKQKTLEDFPKFEVIALRRGPTAKEGYTHYEIEGCFDRTIEIASTGPQWFWLVFGKRGYICAAVQSRNNETNAAVLTFEARDEPNIVGHKLAYLSPYWQGFHVGMVLDPNWGWERKQFQGTDAVAEDYEAKDVSIVGGREVRVWTKLEPTGESTGQSRHYPAPDQTLPVRSGTRLVPAGWGHEHCELCNAHIDAGMFGYCDPGERWMCEKCYQRYVTPHDLAFVDEL
jgi:hypothetical protein